MNPMNTQSLNHVTLSSLLDSALLTAQEFLSNFAVSSSFLDKLATAFGENFNLDVATNLSKDWQASNFSNIPPIQILKAHQLPGAKGAFAAATNRIYLSDKFIFDNQHNLLAVAEVLLEEIGHKLDKMLNSSEAPGDEGAIFSALVMNKHLTESDLQALKAEDDIAWIELDGQLIEIEQATYTGTAGADSLNGGAADDTIFGLNGNDTLTGESGNDTLDGGSGADRLIGGNGDDIYRIDNTGDVIVENSGEGTDTVQSAINYTLNSVLENLTLIGTSNINGTGNSLNNTIIGNSGNNVLSGLGGDDIFWTRGGLDTIDGGAGFDIFFADFSNPTFNPTGKNIDFNLPTYVSLTSIEQINITGSNSDDNFILQLNSAIIANDIVNGGLGNDTINGGVGNDTLRGGDGDDSLIGGLNNDVLEGGNGNDTYVIDAGDTLIDSSGIDTVTANFTYTLLADFENLTLTGTGNATGTGNNSNNVIIGNTGNNTLDGRGGTDTLDGGLGNDTYIVDDASDFVSEGATAGGTDTVQSSASFALATGNNIENLTLLGSSNIDGTGNELANVITGNSGNNILDGGLGADTLNGGSGDDTYVVNDAGDVVIDLAGIDLVQSSITYTLGGSLENLTLTGGSDINGTGNGLGNVLNGNTGNNTLNGGDGNDTLLGGDGSDSLIGGSGNDSINGGIGADTLNGGIGSDTLNGGDGNDTYIIDSTDILSDSEGTDTVFINQTYILLAGFENLTLTDATNANGTGNTSNNIITGNTGNNNLSGLDGNDSLTGGDGNDALNGGVGTDTLNGGNGADRFILNNPNAGADIIADFVTGSDQIQISRAAYGGNVPGLTSFALNANDFVLGISASDTTDRFIYDLGTGSLWYDIDGLGGTSQVLIATLTGGPTLAATDFVITA